MKLSLLFVSSLAFADYPVDTTIVSHEIGKIPCTTSFYADLTISPNAWSFPFGPNFDCGDSVLDVTGKNGFANVALSIRPKTIIALVFSHPVSEITVRRCVGCGSVTNEASDVDLSADRNAWVRTSTWTRAVPQEGPDVVSWLYNKLGMARISEESTVTLSSARTVVFMRGVEKGTQKWLPDVFSVKGVAGTAPVLASLPVVPTKLSCKATYRAQKQLIELAADFIGYSSFDVDGDGVWEIFRGAYHGTNITSAKSSLPFTSASRWMVETVPLGTECIANVKID